MKNWKRNEIENLISRNNKAVERAIIRLFKGNAFHNRDVEAGTHFGQWLLGMNGRGKIVYPAKELTHPRAEKRFSKMCLSSEMPIDRARRIALMHSEILTIIANEPDSKSQYAQIPLPFDLIKDDDLDNVDQIADDYTRSVDDDMDNIVVTETDGKPWTWADTARLMAKTSEDDFDWDEWKDEMKERDTE